MVSASGVSNRPEPELPKIPGYRLERVIGRGATGIVFRAVQLAVERPVAIKILHRELVGAKRAVRRLQREARTAARLSHPAIISAIDMGEIDGQWWFAMELVEGVSLAERLREKERLSEREALRLFLPLCDGLQHAYEKGVVHRDIKPANILIDQEGRARIVDLGLAFAESDPMLTSAGGTLGTPHYISPEQARDPGSADTRSDIWSLGATLYHVLCGRTPFHGESVAEILSSVLYRPVQDPREFVPSISKGMALVLRKCLARDPERRYQTPAELAADLERLRERRAPRVRAAGLDPFERRRPRWLAPGLISVGLALGGTAIWFGRGRGSSADEQESLPKNRREWPALGALRERIEQQQIGLAPAVQAILALQIPAELELDVEKNALLTSVLVPLEASLQELWVIAQRTVEDRLARRDFAGADAWLERDFFTELETRVGARELGDLPRIANRQINARVYTELQARVEEARLAAVEAAQSDLQRYLRDAVFPQAQRAAQLKHWRTAETILAGALSRWRSEHEPVLAGLAPIEIAEMEAAVGASIGNERSLLKDEVERENAQLVAMLPGVAARLHGELREGARGVAQSLRVEFERALMERGITRSELPEQIEFSALDRLQSTATELESAEAAQRIADAQYGFHEAEAEARLLIAGRRYAEATELWRTRLSYDWLEPVREAIDLRLRECALLHDILLRATERIVESNGKECSLYGTTTIAESGVLRVGPDPLGRGFELMTSAGRTLRYRLAPDATGSFGKDTPVQLRDFERLAGLQPPLGVEKSFLLALLRYAEGDYLRAQEVLPLLNTTEDPLYGDLRKRIEDARRTRDEELQADKMQLERRLRMIEKLRRQGANQEVQKNITRTLDEFGPLLSEETAIYLRSLRETVQQGGSLRTLQEVFEPAELELPTSTPRAFRMKWHFAEVNTHAWKHGVWIYDGVGWIMQRLAPNDAELLQFGTSPSLSLDPPIDERSRLALALTLERVEPEVATQSLALSLAGFHLALHVDGTVGHWLIDVTSVEDVWQRLHADPAKAVPFTPFEVGQRFVLELSVQPVQSKVEALTIAGQHFEAPPLLKADLEDRRITLYARERLRLIEATLEGKER